MRPRRHAVGILAAALACSLPAGLAAAGSPTQLLGSILSAARGERSVHYVSSAQLGNASVDIVGDAKAGQGSQQIAFRSGGTTGHVAVIVSANTAYIRGDAFTLITFLGLKPTPAAKYAGVWVRIPPTDGHYAAVADGVTLASVIVELEVAKPLSSVPATTIAGQRVVGVKGTQASLGQATPATLYARATGSPLPVREVIGQGTTRATVTFSKWNEPVHVTVPAGSVPIATTGLG